jgi:uncharacterized protein (TIGR03435 family)
MKSFLTLIALFSILSIHGHCEAPQFEVASITPCKPGTPEPPGEHAGMVQFTYPGGRFTAKATTVKFLIEWAYGILPSQHSDGPSWLGDERYDIVAKASGNATDEEMRQMARSLLSERFNLKLHRETREVPVVAVSIGKTPPKLFPPKDEEKRSLKMVPQMDESHKVVSYHVIGTRFNFAQLNLTFARQLGRPILDETGMHGDFDFEIALTPDENAPSPIDPSHILNALRDQLGLVVKSQKAPIEYFVIEHVEKVAAGNQ